MRKNVMRIAMAIAVAWGLSTTGAWGQTTTGSGQTTRSGAKYDVTLKAGTTDAANWKAKAGTGEAKGLPLEGVAEGQTVTLKYDGRKRVKRVTAVKQAAPALGDLYYSDGTWSATLVAGKTPIGVIAYLGTDAFTETGTNVGGSTFTGHGLVLCLKNAASGADAQWSTEMSTLEFGSGARVDNLDALKRTTDVSGYTNTKTLAEKTDAATKYKAAYAAKNYTGLTAPATGTTGWFLPSAQQWVRMMTGLGGLAEGDITWLSWFDNDHTAATAWETAMAKAGTKGTAYESMTDLLWYWSSSEYSNNYAVYLGVGATYTGGDYGFGWGYDYKDDPHGDIRVRPVLAF